MKTKTGLAYTTEKVLHGNKKIIVKIRLDDECGNKHCDFAITATIYEKERGRWEFTEGGCCHDEILKYFPQFKDFVDLHLSDCHGAPLYAIGNGLFLLKEKGAEACAEYLRIPVSLAESLKDIDNGYAAYVLQEAGVFKAWQDQADAAIKHIEELTGERFVNPYSKEEERRNAEPLTEEKVKEILKLANEGYYTPEAIKSRAQEEREAKRRAEREQIEERYDKTIREAAEEKEIMLYLFDRLGSVDNIIYYHHSRTIKFNWHDERFATYVRHWTREEFDRIVNDEDYGLPDDIKLEFNQYNE